ncbi:hypothetical protein SAMN05660903_03226 [Salegentibacter salinarum]|nr:hypothetical protein SAMN05660903_03226 [Salegentibacter salinarum]
MKNRENNRVRLSLIALTLFELNFYWQIYLKFKFRLNFSNEAFRL